VVPPGRTATRNNAGARSLCAGTSCSGKAVRPYRVAIRGPITRASKQARNGHLVSQNEKTPCRKMAKELRILVVEAPGVWGIVRVVKGPASVRLPCVPCSVRAEPVTLVAIHLVAEAKSSRGVDLGPFVAADRGSRGPKAGLGGCRTRFPVHG